MENKIGEIKTQHHKIGGVYARQMELPKGWYAESHKHKFGHMSILSQGVAIVSVNGEKTTYTAPTVVEIKAGHTHSIEALEDTVWFCIHSTDTLQDGSLEPILIEEV